MSILDDDDKLFNGVMKSIHPLNALQSFIKVNSNNFRYINKSDFDNIYPVLNQIWDCSINDLFEWIISSEEGLCYLFYADPKYKCDIEVCRIGIYRNYEKNSNFQPVLRVSQIRDYTFCGMPNTQREDLYNTVKQFHKQIIEKHNLRKWCEDDNIYEDNIFYCIT